MLAEAFLRKHGDERSHCLTRDAMDRLCRYTWSGNARELENVIERALALSDGDELHADDIPLAELSEGDGGSQSLDDFLGQALAEKLTLSELGDRYTARVLESTSGNKARAAKILGINRRTLYRRGFGPSDHPCQERVEH